MKGTRAIIGLAALAPLVFFSTVINQFDDYTISFIAALALPGLLILIAGRAIAALSAGLLLVVAGFFVVVFSIYGVPSKGDMPIFYKLGALSCIPFAIACIPGVLPSSAGPGFLVRRAVVKVLSKIIRIRRALASIVADAKAEAET